MIALQDVSNFRFEWPWALLVLLLIPLWWWLYATYRRKRLQQTALQFSYTAVAAQLRQSSTVWKRLLYPVTVSFLLACLAISLARPMVTARVPVRSADLMLVLDISLSMMAEDIHPSRIEAAKTAAENFVRSLPRNMRVGVEFFAGDNYILTPPTQQHNEVIAYLQALRKEDLKPRTEIGSALHTALQVLKDSNAPHSAAHAKTPESNASEPSDMPPNGSSDQNAPAPDRVIVLLSDGDSHEGYPWDLAAKDARKEHVVIHSIGIGSPGGSTITYHGIELPVSFDESTLRRIAEIADGHYFRVFKEQDFQKVYEQIQARTVHYEERDLDLAFLLAGVGLTGLIVALGLAGLLVI
jgi:Ca-activated chloride channel family protein